jgi:divalent metal cation (Fe/Co/Zn/Cd) transporter
VARREHVALTSHRESDVTATPETDLLRQRGIRLEWATNGWNLMEVFVTVTLGILARSLALVAFGLDSLVEIFASSVVIWNLNDRRHDPGDRRIHRSLRLIALAFWVLAGFLCVASVRGLVQGTRPGHTLLGITYLGLTAVVMFGLSALKRHTAQQIPSETLLAEAALTFLDGCLATSVLAALVLNYTLGWWWADALAALIVAGFALTEGVRHWLDSAPHESVQSG